MSAFQEINQYWQLVHTFSVNEAAALIAGVDPNSIDESGEFFRDRETNWTDSQGIAGVHTVRTALRNDVNARKLKAVIRRAAWARGWDEEPGKDERFTKDVSLQSDDLWESVDADPHYPKHRGVIYRVSPDWDLTTVERDDVIAWLLSRDFRPSFFFPDTTVTPDFLDRNHPRYAPKLAAAVSVWREVDETRGKSPRRVLEERLRQRAAEFGLVDNDGNPVQQAIEECAKVANWRPSGGAPKTPGG
jgi:hypothetical protein